MNRQMPVTDMGAGLREDIALLPAQAFAPVFLKEL
jgi:hypothetical protein